MKTKKPKTELVVCASALLKLDLSTPISVIEGLIGEGYLHLHELQASVNCNPLLVSGLAYRLDRAETILEQQKRKQAEEQKRRDVR